MPTRKKRAVGEFMQPCPQAIPMSASVQEAAARMSQAESSWLPVRGPTGPVGVVSAGDIVRRGAAQSKHLSEARVADIMTLGLVCCYASDSVAAALRLMKLHRVSQIGVLDDTNSLAAVASTHDLIDSMLRTELSER